MNVDIYWKQFIIMIIIAGQKTEQTPPNFAWEALWCGCPA